MIQRGSLSRERRERLAEWADGAGCRLLVLFGSAADASAATAARDVDLALSFDALPDPADRLRFTGELQDLCEPLPVDVVFLHRDSDPVLRFEVFRRGIPIHEARPGLFVDEVVRAVALYEDALPFRRALRASFRPGGAS